VALLQLTEQEPVQVMWQVELPLQLTLPLGPTVVVQVELLAQFRLHESVHAPEQAVWFSQESEQLPASPPQIAALKSQLIPELHVQLAPVQAGGGAEEDPPQAERTTTQMARSVRIQHFRLAPPIAQMTRLTRSALRIHLHVTKGPPGSTVDWAGVAGRASYCLRHP
jgi:hypothetical protein